MYQSSRRRLSGWHALCAGRHLFSPASCTGNPRNLFYTYGWIQTEIHEPSSIHTHELYAYPRTLFSRVGIWFWTNTNAGVGGCQIQCGAGRFSRKKMEFWVMHSFTLNLVSHIEILAPHFWSLVPFIFESWRQFFKIVSFRRVWGGGVGRSPGPPRGFVIGVGKKLFAQPLLLYTFIQLFIPTKSLLYLYIPMNSLQYITLFIYPRTLLYTIPRTFCFAYHEFSSYTPTNSYIRTSSYTPTNSYIRTNKSFRRRHSRGQA